MIQIFDKLNNSLYQMAAIDGAYFVNPPKMAKFA